jgi:fructose-bisphosphate aldolase class II
MTNRRTTHLDGFFARAVRAALEADAGLVDPRRYPAAGRTALAEEAERPLRLFATAAA